MKVAARQGHALEILEIDVRAVRDAMLAAEAERAAEIAATHPAHRRSAANLVHYLELRHHDVRDLQARLAAAGLSSLGRSEAHVLATVEEVLSVLARLNGHEPPLRAAGVALSEGHESLAANAEALLGTSPGTRGTRIMVTLPTEAANDRGLVAQMTQAGMDIARVNCAHDGPETWTRMIGHVRSTRRTDGHRPRVAMDLAGPKLRTGPLRPGPRVVRISPRRDRLGVVTAPAIVRLTCDPTAAIAAPLMTVVPVDDASWLERRRPGDRLEFVDSRDATRHWIVVEACADGCLATATQTAYVNSGLKLVCTSDIDEDAVTVGDLPEVEQVHRVDAGDHLTLTRALEPAEPTVAGRKHRIGCTLPEAFEQAEPGERVWLDDGKIGGVILRVTSDEIELRVTDIRPGGVNLKAGKGINFPDTDLRLDALTARDLDDLDFVARHADIVNLSFVRHPADVEQLQAELERRDAADVGIVLKIENVAAFEHLPELLLTAMRSRKVGVMIARGDLAVEVGFERLAEVQEEILWACEAAHAPVIWATQVLDTLARTGQPSRAEITDAAMSERAECVMLNKGPHITDAIHTLDSILTRMQHHQHKKRSLLRRLQAWDRAPSHDGDAEQLTGARALRSNLTQRVSSRGAPAMAMQRKTSSTRKAPDPSESHTEIDDWMRRVMPDLNPIVTRLDELIRETHSDLQFAVKWKKAYYGLPDVGWMMEMVAYDVSVNIVFFGGAEFDPPPPLGDADRSRYIKLKTMDEVAQPELRSWIEQAGRVPGWRE